MNSLLLEVVNSAIRAGKAILEIYNSDDFQITEKADNSPLTKADIESNKIINETLLKFDYPIISEENKQTEYSTRKNWQNFWLVDPLDGTKEFIKKRGNFTVNIAFIKDKKPIKGIIYIPVKKTLYFSSEEIGAFKIENVEDEFSSFEKLIHSAQKLENFSKDSKLRVIASQSHFDENTEAFIDKLKANFGNVELLNIGSSLKLAWLAENKADIYPRFGPTMEWDIAAGHAILAASGGSLINLQTKKEFSYNKENLLNGKFLALNSLYTDKKDILTAL